MGWLFGKKKSQDTQVLDNKQNIQELAGSFDSLMIGVQDAGLKQRLADVQEKVKYFNPTNNVKALDIDKKIARLVGDIKIALSKTMEEEKKVEKISSIILEIEMLVPDRINFANLKLK